MKTLEEIWPVLGLSVTAGAMELRSVRDTDIPALCDLVEAGIHSPDRMPFSNAWTDAPKEQLAANTAAYFWRGRSDVTPEHWILSFVVRWHGEIVGIQGFHTDNYLVTKTGETGSWLGQEHQGKGIGTRMRQLVCALVFDHLDGEEITSGAFVDNPASLAVSRKVGYRPNGITRAVRRPGELARLQKLILTPADLVRPEDEIVVRGLPPVRRQLGLDSPPTPSPEMLVS